MSLRLLANASPQPYPNGLEPTGTTLVSLGNHDISVPTAAVRFEPGDRSMLVDTFGGKGIVLHRGEAIFAEMAIHHLCVEAGWSARWLETYGAALARPALYDGWLADQKRSDQQVRPIEDDAVNEVLAAIARQRGSYSGGSDVVAWTEDAILFIESKLRRKDKLRDTQRAWISAALEVGVGLDHFLFVDWDYASPA